MKAVTRSISNYYWSWRRYFQTELASSYSLYYNPVGMPKPTDVDSWAIFLTGDYNPSLFTKVKSQIHCVAREDEDSDELMDIVTDVVGVLDNPDTGLRSIDFYDKPTAVIIGKIWIEALKIRTQQPYDTGISSVLIDIYTRVKTGRSNR